MSAKTFSSVKPKLEVIVVQFMNEALKFSIFVLGVLSMKAFY
jgi:hypothetical protein